MKPMGVILVGMLCLAPTLASASCFDAAGARYGVSPLLLKAIQKTENAAGDPSLVRENKNGTKDYGLMQINTVWMGQLSKYGVRSEHLLDPCINVMVGAWILSNHIARHGLNWESVGRYHSSTQFRRDAYAEKVRERLVALGWRNDGS